MKLIIDIPEKAYELRLTNPVWYDSNIDKAIRNGTPLEEELKKIKAEIHKLAFDDDDGDYMGIISDDEVMELIEKHISELKGE